MSKKRVAIYLSGVHNLNGGGGVERFFADFYSLYSNYGDSKFELYFFTDETTFRALKEVNKLQHNIPNIVLLRNVSNRFKKNIENLNFRVKLKKHRIEILHCANYGRQDFNRLFYISQQKSKPILVVNIVDCQVPYTLQNPTHPLYKTYFERYVEQPNKIKFDGVFSWYELFIKYFNENKLYTFKPIQESIRSRFANTELFKPNKEKKNVFIFASRLHEQKKPEWFIEAVNILKNQNVNQLSNWNFQLYGEGAMENQLKKLVDAYQLNDLISFHKSGDLSKVLATTKVYVSTQDFENFPSLSMMEAMACGNIVIARNVGQTYLMVKPNVNGFLLEEDSPKGLATCMFQVINLTDIQREELQVGSLNMINEVHTPKNFFNQIEEFWGKLQKKN